VRGVYEGEGRGAKGRPFEEENVEVDYDVLITMCALQCTRHLNPTPFQAPVTSMTAIHPHFADEHFSEELLS